MRRKRYELCTEKVQLTIKSLFVVFCDLQEETTDWEAESVDSRGIPGWDRVDRLARALLSLSGLSVTNTQASQIQHLYTTLVSAKWTFLIVVTDHSYSVWFL